jgi:hypothetical protein
VTLSIGARFECDTCHRKVENWEWARRIPDLNPPGGWISYEGSGAMSEMLRHRCDLCVAEEYRAAAAAVSEEKSAEASEKIRSAMAEDFARWAEANEAKLSDPPKPRRRKA